MTETDKRSFVLRRIHSLTGVIPVGLFLLEHMFTNSAAMYGGEVYNSRVEFLLTLPFVTALEIGMIFLPLLYHAIYGVVITFTGRANNIAYGYGRNHNYLWQRISGFVVAIFIVLHVGGTKIWAIQQTLPAGEHPDFFARMATILDSPAAIALYLVGMLAAFYHFANGLWNFSITWGITVSQGAQRRLTVVWVLLGLALMAVGVASVLSFNGIWPGSPGH
ncbi:MAG: succinate dehydrogenase [bacterium]|nr:succinate dehydrogenase [bacterium]